MLKGTAHNFVLSVGAQWRSGYCPCNRSSGCQVTFVLVLCLRRPCNRAMSSAHVELYGEGVAVRGGGGRGWCSEGRGLSKDMPGATAWQHTWQRCECTRAFAVQVSSSTCQQMTWYGIDRLRVPHAVLPWLRTSDAHPSCVRQSSRVAEGIAGRCRLAWSRNGETTTLAHGHAGTGWNLPMQGTRGVPLHLHRLSRALQQLSRVGLSGGASTTVCSARPRQAQHSLVVRASGFRWDS